MNNKQKNKIFNLKRSIFIGIIATIFSSVTTTTFADEIKKLDVFNKYVTIEGKLNREVEGAPVTLLVTDSDIEFTDKEQWLLTTGTEFAYYKDIVLDSGKTYSFKFVLNNPGVYTAYLASNSLGIEKTRITYIDKNENDSAISDVLSIESENELEQLEQIIETKLLDLGVFEFEAEDISDKVAGLLFNEIKEETSIEMNDMRTLIEKAVFINKINNGELIDFYDYPKCALLETEIFKHCTSDVVKDVIQTMSKTEIQSISDFDRMLIETTILEIANTQDGATKLKNILTEYATYLGITKTITIDMCESLIKSSEFSGFDAVKTAIKNYSPNNGGGTNIGSNNNGGGSSGGGSSSNRYNGTTAVIDVRPQQKPQEISPFDDISNVGWASEAITALYKANVINGKSDRLFYPMDNVTREEFAKILMMTFNVRLVDAECPFEDISEDDWSYEYVRTAYLAGVVHGINETTFGKKFDITRQDLCVMVYRLLNIAENSFESSKDVSAFVDKEDIADYAVEAVSFLKDNGIISGDEQRRFNPNSSATRAEVAKIVYNAKIFFEKN